MEEEWWNSLLKGGCAWVTHTLSTRGGKGPRWSEGKEHDRSGAGEEGYTAGCEGSERNGTRPLRSSCCTV